MREAGAEEQVKVVTDRLSARDRYREQARQLQSKPAARRDQGQSERRYREESGQPSSLFGREPDGRPAPAWGWDDLD